MERKLLFLGLFKTLGLPHGLNWLHYVEETDLVFCYTCVSAVKQKKLLSMAASKMDGTFISNGFVKCKDATVSFRKHELR